MQDLYDPQTQGSEEACAALEASPGFQWSCLFIIHLAWRVGYRFDICMEMLCGVQRKTQVAHSCM